MSPISASSIKRILKKKLGYSFKRISTLEHNSIKPFNIWKFFESAILKIKLEEKKIELIFIDAFSLSSRYNKLYCWSKVGQRLVKDWSKVNQKGYVLTHYDSFSMFFVATFSEKVYMDLKELHKEWMQHILSISLVKFLKKGNSWRYPESKFWIIWDYVSIHTRIVVN